MVARARRLERFLTQPFFTTGQFTGLEGKLVSLEDALDGCERILRDEFEDTPDIDFGGILDYDTNKSRTVDSFMTLNLQLRYTGLRNTQLSLGLDNALDEKPPFAIGDGDTDLYGYVSSQHDPRGRYVYGKVTYSF